MEPAIIDPDLFGQLLEEEGLAKDSTGLRELEREGEGEGELEREYDERPDASPSDKGVGRLYPPKKPTDKGVRSPSPAAGGAGKGSGSLPSFMRGTASSASKSPAASHAAAAGSGSSSSRPSSRPSSATTVGSTSRSISGPHAAGGAGKSGTSPRGGKSGRTQVAGKDAFSELPENAGWANLIKDVEATIVAANTVSMDDVVGLEDAKRVLEEVITFPRVLAELGAAAASAAVTKGVLLFGPPGTGKTQLARAVSSSGGCTFFAIGASTLVSKWMGESEKMIKAAFDAARYYAPSVIFIDEIDALTGERGEGGGGSGEAMMRVKNEMLSQIDGMASTVADPTKFVLTLGATNRPWSLDEAFRRRLEKRILIPLPDARMREELYRKALSKATASPTAGGSTGGLSLSPSIDFSTLARLSDGYSAADIIGLCRDSTIAPLRELAAEMKAKGLSITAMPSYVANEKGGRLPPITMLHLLDSLKRIKSSVDRTGESAKKLQAWMSEFGSA